MKGFVEKLICRLEEETIALEDNFGDLVECIPKDIAIEIVNQIAEEYKGGWIHCSERLPENSIEVLVSKEDGILDFDMYEYEHEDWKFNSKHHKNKVVAWMPLPEPFEPKVGE